MIAPQIHHIAGLLAIATPETLASPAFIAALRARVNAAAAAVERLEAITTNEQGQPA
ncbi:hypothetical protein [Falsiroseomonas sp.]|uniref:hypothetical protein n=1 Tax=Falsiroseomonas sp. TaxID=2870721 RepID=UPI003F718D51